MVTEEFLKPLGFKKKWLSDKSGFWFEYRFYKDRIYYKFIIELSKPNLFSLEIRTGDFWGYKVKLENYNPVLTIKLTERMY